LLSLFFCVAFAYDAECVLIRIHTYEAIHNLWQYT
jgi:hypothetical protein